MGTALGAGALILRRLRDAGEPLRPAEIDSRQGRAWSKGAWSGGRLRGLVSKGWVAGPDEAGRYAITEAGLAAVSEGDPS